MTTRRSFLKTTAGVAAGSALAGIAGPWPGFAAEEGDGRVLIGRFEVDGRPVFGRLVGETVELLSAAEDPAAFPDIDALAGRPAAGRTVAASDATWLPPVYASHRVFALALNYRPHAAETGYNPPESPLVFYKPPSAFVAPYGELRPRPGYTEKFDYEGEIGIVIGRTCTNVSAENALDYVRGITAVMDGSARDRLRIPAGDRQFLDWIGAKAFDNGSQAGPVVACGEQVIEAIRSRSLNLTTRLNGEKVQEAPIGDLIFPVEELIAFLSGVMTLSPGDVISAGTPEGVGQARGRFLQSGDRLTIDVTHLPTLVATVA